MARAGDDTRAVEALIFASEAPASLAQLRRALPGLTAARLRDAVAEINAELDRDGRPYAVVSVAGGYQFRTRPRYGDLIRASRPERRVRMSRAALETLSVIAYRQPLTRAEIEQVRCVDCGAVLRGLSERGLVRVVGRRDAPGRPPLYGTTAGFLEAFGLGSLRELPELPEPELEPEPGTPIGDARDGAEDRAAEPAPAEDAEVR